MRNEKPAWAAPEAQDTKNEARVDAALFGGLSNGEQAHWRDSVLDAIPVPISVISPDMTWLFANKAAEALLGAQRGALAGRPCSSCGFSVCRTGSCGVARALLGFTQTFFSHKGASYQMDVSILRDLGGKTTGYIETLRDVTEVELMARQQADAANKAKSTFLATMSHEMRTPLNAIIGMTAIGKKAADIGRKDYALDKIEEASAHLLGVINDVLDMSKIEENKLELSPVEFCFEHMLQKVITVINFRVNEKRQKFLVHVNSDVPRFVVGDDQRLAQVIANLLSNAVKFTPEGGAISLTAALAAEKDGAAELRIEVADNGIGISPRQQARLFSAFSQAESGTSREFGGTGLGLAISKRIVELMGGGIRVVSQPGKGARFIFTVKMPVSGKSPRLLLKPGVAWEAVRVLVADDSPLMRQYLGDSFAQLGLACDTAASGAEACRLVEARAAENPAPGEEGFGRHRAFDVFFIDWMMPDMDGVALTKWLRKRGERGAVILISSADWEDLKTASLHSGANKCLTKPILSPALVECMNEYLAAEENPSGGQNAALVGKTLLLAEDIAINREIVLSLLGDTGLIIDCAESGAEALAMVKAAPDKYDAILMDMHMPLMDGLEATRRIRALPARRCKKLPIIAMTANVFKEDIERCLAAGMDDHIGKPLDLDDVLEKLRRHIAGEGA